MQETSHRDAIHLLITADRRSLNAELSDARTELESVRCELHAAKEQHATELQQWEQQTQTLQLQAKEHGTAITTTATTHAHTHTHTGVADLFSYSVKLWVSEYVDLFNIPFYRDYPGELVPER